MKELRSKSYNYYYYINDNMNLVNGFFFKSVQLYESINDINKIAINLKNDIKGTPKKQYINFNPIKYNNNIWLTNWLEFSCFMFEKKFFNELGYNLGNIKNYDMNKYITNLMYKHNKHTYLVAQTLVNLNKNLLKH